MPIAPVRPVVSGTAAIVPTMASLDDVSRMATGLPEVTEGERHGHRAWFVDGKVFAWERSFSKADIRRFGEAAPPAGPIVAIRVADLAEKEAVLASSTDAIFTIPHFDGYASVLVQLKTITKKALRDAWAGKDKVAGYPSRRRAE
jgi:hypothetical protein